MNKKELIERIECLKKIFGNKVKYIEIDAIIELVSKLDEPETGHADEAPRYVKNILARLRELPLHDREVWLKAIMSEFEQDFCHAKWREGYEQGKFDGEWVGNQLKDADKIRRELNQVKIPQFVAEIIEYYKGQNATLYDALREKNFNKQYNEWLMNEQDAYNKVARAWLDGYEVEKEKRYRVKIKGICGNHETLNREKHSNKWLFSDREENSLYGTHHTRKELEEAGFGWVLDCPGIELEEVIE
jgi:phage protein